MVIFAIGGVVGGVILGAAAYDDYSNYSNHSDYSDQAERQRREKEARMQSLNKKKNDIEKKLNNCKEYELAEFIEGSDYELKDATEVNTYYHIRKMDEYANASISSEENAELEAELKSITDEISRIDMAINELEEIKRNNT